MDQSQEESYSALEVFIFTPTGQDAKLLSQVIEEQGFKSEIFADLATLCEKIACSRGAALLIAEEALTKISVPVLNLALERQEPWSDIPIVLLTSNGQETVEDLRRIRAFAPSGNVTLLERPLRPITLINTLKVCLRARARQHQVHDLLLDQIAATQRRDDFISIASHELKTPLTAMSLQIQLSQKLLKGHDARSFDAERIAKGLDSFEKQVQRLKILVEDLLDVTRITAGHLTLSKTLIDLSELTKEIVDRTEPQLTAAGCRIEMDLAAGLTGFWDRFRIEQILNNLLTNVIKYAAGKPVAIHTRKEEGLAVLSIRDQGIGISREDQRRIFTRFERAVDAKNISGLGLGLYICKEIVELHHGSITVSSRLGDGAEFTVRLPAGVPSRQ